MTAHGEPVFDQGLLRSLGLSGHLLAPIVRAEREEARRRLIAYRGADAPARVAGRVVVVVDDGVATGVTARAALREVLAARPAPAAVWLAAPVGSKQAINQLAAESNGAYRVACPLQPPDFQAVSRYYRDFHQVTDDEVRAALG